MKNRNLLAQRSLSMMSFSQSFVHCNPAHIERIATGKSRTGAQEKPAPGTSHHNKKIQSMRQNTRTGCNTSSYCHNLLKHKYLSIKQVCLVLPFQPTYK